MNKSQIRLP